jgi:uncharacterized protein YndB with AHSA1/START domain
MRTLFAAVLLLTCSTAIVAKDEPAKLAPMKTGEFWYAQYTPEGAPEGYAHVTVRDTKGGGVHVSWDFHIASNGTYEEERETTFNADGVMTHTEYKSGLNRCVASREGDVMVGKLGYDDIRVEAGKDAAGTLGWMLAAWLPQTEGATLTRTSYDEPSGLKPGGALNYKVGAAEKVKLDSGEVEAFKVSMELKERGFSRTIWVGKDRTIVQVDWGGGALMKLSDAGAKELFKPQPPVLEQLEQDDKTRLVLQGDFAGYTLEEMWKAWATAEGITKWWPPLAEIEGKVGGKFELTWKTETGEIQWQLTGKVEVWEPNKKFGFTWRWNETPAETPDLHVVVEFSEVEGGVRVKITHSKFDPLNDDQKNRESLKQGWEYFCTNLRKK